MAIMIHSQPSATSGMSNNAGANGNGFHTGEFVSGGDSLGYGTVPEDMVLLDHDVGYINWVIGYSKNEAGWNVSEDTYTSSPDSTPQNDVVLQFKLHELGSNGTEAFWLLINDDFVSLGSRNAHGGYEQGESFSWESGQGYSVSMESSKTEGMHGYWFKKDAEHLVTITIDKYNFSQSPDLYIDFFNTRLDNSYAERWGISALNMFEDNGGDDNGLASWAAKGTNMRISTLSPDSDVNSLWNAIETQFDNTANTLQGMVKDTTGNTYFNVGLAEDDDISAAEIADAAYSIEEYLESFYIEDGFGTLDDVAEEMWVSSAAADFISPSENNVGLAGRIFQYINYAIHVADAENWQKLAKGAVGDISGALLHIETTLEAGSSNQLPDEPTLGDELTEGMGNLINEMKGTLSLHLQRAKWEKDQRDIDVIQRGLDALTTASDRFVEELMELSVQLSAMTILFDMFGGESTAQRADTEYHSTFLPRDMADIVAWNELGYDVKIEQGHNGINGKHRLVQVREGDDNYAVFDGIDGFDYKIGVTEHHDGTRTFDTSYDFVFV